jgi:Protein of unknown function (DUF2442)
MIKLIATERKDFPRLVLRFSDGAWGDFDFAPYISARTEMTEPLADTKFFDRHFIEAGALAWPNGFDLSAESLYRRLEQDHALHHDARAA